MPRRPLAQPAVIVPILAKRGLAAIGRVDADGQVRASLVFGTPGCLRTEDDTTLRIPGHACNSVFNTLGNFSVDPRAGRSNDDLVPYRRERSGRARARAINGPGAGSRRPWTCLDSVLVDAGEPYRTMRNALAFADSGR